jgi:glycosyltransferase involved in cell wall biosynthesis
MTGQSEVLLSIVIPVFNVEKYLRECIDSVLNQDLKNCEIICINDGSTDSSRAILKEYQYSNSHLKVIDQPNGGLGSARNTGLLSSVGRYIYFLDSDDFLLPESIAKIKTILVSEDLEVLVCNALINGEVNYFNNSPVFQNRLLTGDRYIKLSYQVNNTFAVPIWLHVYKREFLISNNFYFVSRIYYEDELFTPVVLHKANRVFIINEYILHYRFNRPYSITQSVNQKHFDDRKFIANKLISLYIQDNSFEEEYYRKLLEFLLISYDLAYSQGILVSKYFLLNKSQLNFIKQKVFWFNYDRKCIRLLQFNLKLLVLYRRNMLNVFVRKFINRFV